MNNQIIYFTCALFAMVAITAVTAQDNSTILDNSTMNNMSLLNNTTLNASMNETLPVQNGTAPESTDTAPALNETLPVQNETVPASNDTAPALNEALPVQNETVPASNDTAPALNETLPVQNETVPASNETASENVLLATEPVSVSSQLSVPLAIGSIQMESSQNSVFAVSRLASSPATFSIENQPLHKEAYEVGLPAETIMDLSALPFYVNKI
ncbi:MAG: hypothetical protein LUQ59_01625 [Methanothrix sp.]|nr:hypothetical protein [Methanothrix sp.]